MLAILQFLFGAVVCGAVKRQKYENASSLVNSSRILDSLLDGYDKRLGPFVFEGEATVVKVGLFIVDIETIEDQRMEYTTSVLVRRTWRDPRLSYDVTNFPNVSHLNIQSDVLSMLWVPDLAFTNAREGDAHELTRPNIALYLYPGGHVFLSSKLTLRLACPMNMQKFPIDIQYCKVEMETYAHPITEIQLTWMDSKLEIPSNLNLIQFTLLGRGTEDCNNLYSVESRQFSCLRGVFVLKRKFEYHIIAMFIPSGFIVVVSWVSFWINPDAVPGRITLSVTTVLTMITQGFVASFTLPQVPYVKAIDVWMTACTTFVFAAFLEYALVNVLQRKQNLRKSQALQQKVIASHQSLTCQNGGTPDVDIFHSLASLLTTVEMDTSETVIGTALKIDMISRIAFPFAFMLFSISFWTYYLLWEPERPDLKMGDFH